MIRLGVGEAELGVSEHDLRRRDGDVVELDVAAGMDDSDELGLGATAAEPA